MDWTLIFKLLAAVAAIFTASKVLFDYFFTRRSNLREEYKFAKEFLDGTDKETLHPYTLSKGYQAIAGTGSVKASEVKYILSLENPLQCLNDFVLSKELFERIETEGNFKLIFREKYKSDFSRTWRKRTFVILYFILAFAAFSPVFLSIFIRIELIKFITMFAITFPLFGVYAWISLQAYAKFIRGEFIFNNQSQHSPRVLTRSHGRNL